MFSGKNTVVAGHKHKNSEAVAKDKFNQAVALEKDIASLPRPSLEILETIKNLFKEAADLNHPGATERLSVAQNKYDAEELKLALELSTPSQEPVAPVILMKPLNESIADLKVKIVEAQKKVDKGELSFEYFDFLKNELKRLTELSSTSKKTIAPKVSQQQMADAIADFKKGKNIEDNRIGLTYKKDAFDLYEKSANAKPNGYPPAQYYTAICYMLGYGTDKDMKKALPLLNLAAKNNQPNAQFTLAAFHLGAEGVRRDEKAAASLYAQASVQGHPRATNQLGLLTLLEYGVALTGEKAKQEAVRLFQKANALASQPLKFESLYEMPALNASSASPAFNFAWCREHGIGIEKDTSHAIKIYSQLASQNDFMAMYALDKHEPKNNWLNQAAIAGAARNIEHPEGFHHLLQGIRFENGYDEVKDAHEALKHYQIAFNYGFQDAALFFEALTDRLKLMSTISEIKPVINSSQFVYSQPVASAVPPKSDKPTPNPGGAITAGLPLMTAEEMEDLEEESAKANAKNISVQDEDLLKGYETIAMFHRRSLPSLTSHGYEQFNVMATDTIKKAKQDIESIKMPASKTDVQSDLITLSGARVKEVGNEILEGIVGDIKRGIKPKPYKKISLAGSDFKSVESLKAMVDILTNEQSPLKQKIIEVDFADSLNKLSEEDKNKQLKRLGHLSVFVAGRLIKVDVEDLSPQLR